MSTTLPIRLEKQIAGKCLYSGCGDDAIDGSDYCGPHDAHERGRAATRQRRHRQKLADSGLCIAGCGRKVARQRGADGKVKRRRCSSCRNLHGKQVRDSRAKLCVTGDDRGVTGDATDPAWRVDPGTTWKRFRGKGRRGRLTREEQIDEIKRSVRFAVEELQKLDRALEQLKRPEVMELPPIQRAAAWRQASMFAGSAERHCEDCRDALE